MAPVDLARAGPHRRVEAVEASAFRCSSPALWHCCMVHGIDQQDAPQPHALLFPVDSKVAAKNAWDQT